jgi:hypothetical protein
LSKTEQKTKKKEKRKERKNEKKAKKNKAKKKERKKEEKERKKEENKKKKKGKKRKKEKKRKKKKKKKNVRCFGERAVRWLEGRGSSGPDRAKRQGARSELRVGSFFRPGVFGTRADSDSARDRAHARRVRKAEL